MPFPQSNTQLNEQWQYYQHPLVRQLAFAIGSPNILTSIPQELDLKYDFELHSDVIWQAHLEAYHPRLIQLDADPTELIRFVSTLKSTRLGLRFEMLVWFWLLDDTYHHYTLLGHSIQKIEGARTVGELDFLILNNQTQQIEHWEVALKYYLAETNLSLPHWYGLNRSDTLKRKLNHFTQKQFQFEDALGYSIQQRFCMLKGQLYMPPYVNTEELPEWVNTQRRIGVWTSDIPRQQEGYYRLQRHEWIYPEMNPSSKAATWWTDGLYKKATDNIFYMYRSKKLTALIQ